MEQTWVEPSRAAVIAASCAAICASLGDLCRVQRSLLFASANFVSVLISCSYAPSMESAKLAKICVREKIPEIEIVEVDGNRFCCPISLDEANVALPIRSHHRSGKGKGLR